MNREQVVDFFDREAARYDAYHDSTGPRGYELSARLEAILSLLGDGPGDVLDVGMGPGRLCQELARRGWTVAGVDPSRTMVERARRRIPEASSRLLEASLEELPFAPESFDAVVATGVLEYVEDVDAALVEIVRVLRPRGVAAISTPNYGSWHVAWRRVARSAARPLRRALGRPNAPRRRWGRLGGIKRLLAAVGLEVEAAQFVSFSVAPTPLDLLFPRTAVRIARHLEGRGAFAPRLGGQVLILARRTTTDGDDASQLAV